MREIEKRDDKRVLTRLHYLLINKMREREREFWQLSLTGVQWDIHVYVQNYARAKVKRKIIFQDYFSHNEKYTPYLILYNIILLDFNNIPLSYILSGKGIFFHHEKNNCLTYGACGLNVLKPIFSSSLS